MSTPIKKILSNVSQSLSESEKAQARSNIGAASTASLAALSQSVEAIVQGLAPLTKFEFIGTDSTLNDVQDLVDDGVYPILNINGALFFPAATFTPNATAYTFAMSVNGRISTMTLNSNGFSSSQKDITEIYVTDTLPFDTTNFNAWKLALLSKKMIFYALPNSQENLLGASYETNSSGEVIRIDDGGYVTGGFVINRTTYTLNNGSITSTTSSYTLTNGGGGVVEESDIAWAANSFSLNVSSLDANDSYPIGKSFTIAPNETLQVSLNCLVKVSGTNSDSTSTENSFEVTLAPSTDTSDIKSRCELFGFYLANGDSINSFSASNVSLMFKNTTSANVTLGLYLRRSWGFKTASGLTGFELKHINIGHVKFG